MIYLTLFIVAFLSGSLLPLGSEALFLYDIKVYNNIALLTITATIGNTLGSVLNYYMGLKGEEFLIKRAYLSLKKLNLAKKRFNKYGAIVLLFAFLPVVGDPLTFIAGALQYNFKKFLILVFLSKGFRYVFIVFLT